LAVIRYKVVQLLRTSKMVLLTKKPFLMVFIHGFGR